MNADSIREWDSSFLILPFGSPDGTVVFSLRLLPTNPPTYVGGSPNMLAEQKPPTYAGGSPNTARQITAESRWRRSVFDFFVIVTYKNC
ncbi:MAG: hypothetical protein ACRCUY_05635 [Thermoguttaceae bacterium]